VSESSQATGSIRTQNLGHKIVGSCCCNAVLSKVGWVGFVCESMLGSPNNTKNGSAFSVCGFCHSALQSFKCVCVERGNTCAYTKLTFRLHDARHS